MTWEQVKKIMDSQINNLRKINPDIDKLEIFHVEFASEPEVIVDENRIVIVDKL